MLTGRRWYACGSFFWIPDARRIRLRYKLGISPWMRRKMPMRKPRARRAEQTEMFAAPRNLPRWESLRGRTQREVVRLLAQMMRRHLQEPAERRCGDER
jgi:hypothetical protein